MKLYDDLRRMRYIRRFNGKPLTNPENDAEHALYVSQLALKIGIDNKEKVNLESLLAKAILHDAEESVTGDINYDFKHRSEQFYQTIEAEGTKMFNEKFSQSNPELIPYFKPENKIEDRIIKFCDYTEAFFNMAEEYLSGNRHPLLIKSLNRQYEAILNEFREPMFKKYHKELRNLKESL